MQLNKHKPYIYSLNPYFKIIIKHKPYIYVFSINDASNSKRSTSAIFCNRHITDDLSIFDLLISNKKF